MNDVLGFWLSDMEIRIQDGLDDDCQVDGWLQL